LLARQLFIAVRCKTCGNGVDLVSDIPLPTRVLQHHLAQGLLCQTNVTY